MIVMAFDLSSSCIGVTFVQLKGTTIKYLKTIPIIPVRPSGLDFGYTTKKPKRIAYEGNEFLGYLKEGEFSISRAESDRRKRIMRSLEHSHLLRNIAKQCGYYLEKVNPDVILIEKNKSFNGILTTKLLAEIAGGIYFYSGMRDIAFFDYEEATVRARIRKDITEFDLEKDGKVAIDTKWEIYCRLRAYFKDLVDFDNMTLDESDSLAVFYYYYVTEVLK